MSKKTSTTSNQAKTSVFNDEQKQLDSRKQALLTESSKGSDLSVTSERVGADFSCKDPSSISSSYEDGGLYCYEGLKNCHRGKISIIGMGMVGSSYAYSLIQSGLARELVIVDANKDRARGEYLDLSHALSFVPPISIKEGDIKDTSDSQLIVISAGVSQSGPNESRLQLVLRNVAILDKIIPDIVKYAPHANILIATNPVDILVSYTEKIIRTKNLKFMGSVLGSGTVLDSARFQFLLSKHFRINVANVHGMIIGEHGDSELPVWSLANISGMPLKEFALHNGISFNDEIKKEIFTNTRFAAKQIISTKGATYYAIGLSLLKITEAILKDSNTILNVSGTSIPYFGIDPEVSIGYPSVVGGNGIKSRIKLKLSEEEQHGFRESAKVLKNIIDSL